MMSRRGSYIKVRQPELAAATYSLRRNPKVGCGFPIVVTRVVECAFEQLALKFLDHVIVVLRRVAWLLKQLGRKILLKHDIRRTQNDRLFNDALKLSQVAGQAEFEAVGSIPT